MLRELVMGVRAEGDTDLPEAMRQLAGGSLERAHVSRMLRPSRQS